MGTVMARYAVVGALLSAGSWWGARAYKYAVIAVAITLLRHCGIDIEIERASLMGPLDLVLWVALVTVTPAVPWTRRVVVGVLGAAVVFVIDAVVLSVAVAGAVAHPFLPTGDFGSRLYTSLSAAAPSAVCVVLWLSLFSPYVPRALRSRWTRV